MNNDFTSTYEYTVEQKAEGDSAGCGRCGHLLRRPPAMSTRRRKETSALASAPT